MTSRPRPWADRISLGVRLALGATFLISSAAKIADPQAFAHIVANYQLLPQPLVWPTALLFPWVEVSCALALLSGRLVKGAALLVCAMMLFFITVLAYNNYRGLNVACGCFSLATDRPADLVANTVRNLLIFGAGLWVWFSPGRRRLQRARAGSRAL